MHSLKTIFSKLFSQIEIKLVLAQIFLFLSWSFDGKVQIIITVYSLIAIDTFTAVYVVLRLQGLSGISSRKFFRSPSKFVVYLIFLYVSRMVDRSLPISVAGPIMDAFLVTTEAVSILENFAKLNYPVPTFLITKLKAIYEKKD